MFPRDLILEGVQPADKAALRQLRQGSAPVDEDRLRRLEAKGWLDLVSGIPLITLTGGAVLDR